MKWKKCYGKFQQNLWKISVKELFCNKGHLLAELSFPNVKKKIKKSGASGLVFITYITSDVQLIIHDIMRLCECDKIRLC